MLSSPVLRVRTHFRWYRARGLPFSYFARPDSLSSVPRASGHVFTFCTPELIFGGNGGVVSRFLVLRARTLFRRFLERRVPFSCFALPDSFRRYRGLQVPFSRFALADSFSALSGASRPVFLFFLPGLVFCGSEGVVSRFLVLRVRTHFRRYRRRRVPFSCFALPDLFSAVPRASDPVFMFCAPRLIFDGTEDVGSRFLV
jgi:hypothetical protein